MAGGNNFNELKNRVAALEKLLGIAEDTDDVTSVISRIEGTKAELERFREITAIKLAENDGFRQELLTQVEDLKKENEDLKLEVMILRRALAGVNVAHEAERSRVRVPEPKAFDGSRSAKGLENFLYDMEQFFIAARIPENDQLSMATMYLVDDAKLWWRTRNADDVGAGRPRIDSWAKLKKEIRDQFLPSNSSWIARDRLKRLRQTGSLRDYIKGFSSLMLDIKNMSDEDKLHNFISGMQAWAQNELRRQNVKDLQGAMVVADSLVDFRQTPEPSEAPPSPKSRSWADEVEEWDMVGREDHENRSGVVPDAEGSRNKKKSASGKSCWTCGGAHLARNCPNRERVNAMLAKEAQESEEAVVAVAMVNPLGLPM